MMVVGTIGTGSVGPARGGVGHTILEIVAAAFGGAAQTVEADGAGRVMGKPTAVATSTSGRCDNVESDDATT